MPKFVIATTEKTRFLAFAEALKSETGYQIDWVDSKSAVMKAASGRSTQLVIIDEMLGDLEGMELAREIILVNAMVNLVMVSHLPPEDFHEASEGLGIMAQLPVLPEKTHAADIVDRLKKLMPDHHQ